MTPACDAPPDTDLLQRHAEVWTLWPQAHDAARLREQLAQIYTGPALTDQLVAMHRARIALDAQGGHLRIHEARLLAQQSQAGHTHVSSAVTLDLAHDGHEHARRLRLGHRLRIVRTAQGPRIAALTPTHRDDLPLTALDEALP